MRIHIQLFYVIVFFFFTVGFVFNSIHPLVDSIIILSIVITIIGILSKISLPIFFKPFNILIPFFILFLTLAGFSEKVTFSFLLIYVFKPLKIITVLYASYSLIYFLKRKNVNLSKTVFNLIFISILINAIILTLMFNDLALRELIYSYTTTGEHRSFSNFNLRMGGLTGTTGGSVLSVIQSIGVVMTPILIKLNKSVFLKAIILIANFVILYSIFIVGRSGLWTVILFLPLMLILINGKKFVSTIFKISILIVFAILGLSFILNYIVTDNTDSYLIYSLKRTFDTFLEYKKTGGFEDTTVNVLIHHLQVPSDWLTLLIGNPEHLFFTQSDRTLKSDIGYIRNLWSYGVFGMIIYLKPLLVILKKTYKNKINTLEGKFLIVLSLIMLLFHAKENYAYTRMLFSIYALTFVLTFLKDKTKTKELQ